MYLLRRNAVALNVRPLLSPAFPLRMSKASLRMPPMSISTAPSQTSLDDKLALALPLTPVSSSDSSDEAIVSNLVDKSHAILDFLRVEMPVHLLLRPRRSGKTTLLKLFR